MKKFFFLLIACFAFAVAGISQPPSVTGNPDPSAPVMVFKTDSVSFGNITQGDTVTRSFTFTNTGKTPLVITAATATCGCTQPVFPKEPILPGKSGTIKVTFNSTGKMGPQDKVITITSNNRDGVEYVHLIGVVESAPQVKPGTPDPSRNGAPTN
jgi:hypothetical protein